MIINRTFINITDKIKGDGLKAKAARGSLVLAIGTFVERAMRLVRNMILARLLAPEDFGLMAIVLTVLVSLETLTDAGVYQAIIHSKNGAEQEFLNVAWFVQFIRGVGLYVIGFFLAPVIAHFYNKSELVPLLRITMLFVVFNCAMNPDIRVLEKKLRYIKLTALWQGSSLLGTIITMGLALYSSNVWVLVIGRVSESFLRATGSFLFCSFRPRWCFNREYLHELLGFSRGMLGLSFLTIITLQADVFVLGKYVSSELLGIYSLALALAYQPAVILGKVIIQVLFPVFSMKQDNKQFLCKTVGKMLRIIFVFGVPIIGVVTVFSESILRIIYGPKYAVIANTFSVLCFVMLLRTQGAILSKIYMAIGKPHIHRRVMIVLAMLILSLIIPGVILFGPLGVALVLLFSNGVAVCLQVLWLQKFLGKELLRCVFVGHL